MELLTVQLGSHAFGLDRPDSDRDIGTVVIEEFRSKADPALHLKSKDVERKLGTDRWRYPLRYFTKYALTGRLDLLIWLWAPVIDGTEAGRELRALAHSFVSRRIAGTVLRDWKARTNELRVHYDPKLAMHALRVAYQGTQLLRQGRLSLPIPDPLNSKLRLVRLEMTPEEGRRELMAAERVLLNACDDTQLPHEPDYMRVRAFVDDTYREAWNAA